MGDKSHIQWTEASWNPIVGCRKISAGCDHCYAMRDAHRLAGNPHEKVAAAYAGLTMIQNGRVNWTGRVRELSDRLDQPLRWKRPRRIFVNSMSDLFHEDVSEAFIDRVFAVMALAPQHTFQVLTKRPKRLLAYFANNTVYTRWLYEADAFRRRRPELTRVGISNPLVRFPHWIWLGTSVEDQQRAEERLGFLVDTPATVRFLSCEPLLGPLDIWPALYRNGKTVIGWVIIGGESGPHARVCREEWVRDLLNQCRAAGVPAFVKQMGSDWALSKGAQHPKGGEMHEWPEALRVRQFPGCQVLTGTPGTPVPAAVGRLALDMSGQVAKDQGQNGD